MTACGRICIGRRKINLSHVFAGQKVGIRAVADQIWLMSFMHYDLGFFDQEAGRVECADNPFEARVLPMSPARVGNADGRENHQALVGFRILAQRDGRPAQHREVHHVRQLDTEE